LKCGSNALLLAIVAEAIRERLEQLQTCTSGWFKIIRNSLGVFGKVERAQVVAPDLPALKLKISSAVPALYSKT
jgi:hypothetical protein